jgi:hypothetical protein
MFTEHKSVDRLLNLLINIGLVAINLVATNTLAYCARATMALKKAYEAPLYKHDPSLTQLLE